MDKKEAKLANLRQRAEAIFDKVPVASQKITQDIEVITEELHVSQLELEIQFEELQESYQALESAQKRYTKLFNSAPIAYLVIDSQGEILEANLVAATMLKLESKMLKSRNLTDFIAKDFQDIFYLFRLAILNTGQAQRCEIELKGTDGSRLPAQLNANLTDTQSQEICIVITDISNIKESEEALSRVLARENELNPLRMTVLSVLASEFRQPLISILWSLQLLYRHGDKLTAKKKEQLYESGQNLLWYLSATVLDASSIEYFEQQKSQLERFDILEFTRQIIHDIKIILPSGGKIVLDTLIEGENASVIWDRNTLRRILMNLLSEASRNSQVQVPCRVDVRASSIHIEAKVLSEIFADDIAYKFETFSKGENAEFVGGRGNKLFALYQAVQTYEGTITYQPQQESGVSIFIELPRRLKALKL